MNERSNLESDEKYFIVIITILLLTIIIADGYIVKRIARYIYSFKTFRMVIFCTAGSLKCPLSKGLQSVVHYYFIGAVYIMLVCEGKCNTPSVLS